MRLTRVQTKLGPKPWYEVRFVHVRGYGGLEIESSSLGVREDFVYQHRECRFHEVGL